MLQGGQEGLGIGVEELQGAALQEDSPFLKQAGIAAGILEEIEPAGIPYSLQHLIVQQPFVGSRAFINAQLYVGRQSAQQLFQIPDPGPCSCIRNVHPVGDQDDGIGACLMYRHQFLGLGFYGLGDMSGGDDRHGCPFLLP